MRISTKLMLFYVAFLAVFCALGAALVADLRSVSAGYEAVLNSSVRQMDQARIVQVNFKKQVQEWKDTLLRGHNADDLATYTKQFHERERDVLQGAEALSSQLQDPQAKQLVQQFLAARLILSQKYQQAYRAYVEGHADFVAADKIVRGQDRAPTDLFDQVVERLGVVSKQSVETQNKAASTAQNLALGLAGGLVGLLGIVGFLLVRDIVQRLAWLKSVSDRLARADLSGLAIEVSGHDEIAAFGKSMRGVRAAMEELLLLSMEETSAKS
jgi:hypothetical protein